VIKRIIVGLGGTPYTPVAIQRAVGIAKRFEAEITGVTVVDFKHLSKIGPVPVRGEHAADKLRKHKIVVTKEQIEEVISKFESACAEDGIKYQVKLEKRKNPFDLMISLARYHDLMIFGLQSLFEYGISVENTKDLLVRLVSAGVRPIIAVSDEFRSIQKALIAYSGSMESAKTMKRFIQLHLWPDVKIKIVTFQSSEDKAQRLLFDASEYCRAHGFSVETESNPGVPKDLLLPMATLWQADMIVLGNSLRNLLVKRLFGETALHIIRNADQPLFLCQ